MTRHLLVLQACLILVLWVVLHPVCAAAQSDHQSRFLQTGYFEDTSGELTWEEVRDKTFTPFNKILTAGYSSSVFWIQLEIDPQRVPAANLSGIETLVLRIIPTYLDSIKLYDPLQGDTVSQVSGDMTPISNDSYRSLKFNFTLPRGDAPRTVYLQVQSSSSMQVIPRLFSYDEAHESDRLFYLYAGLLLGLLAVIAIWSLLLFITEPEKLTFAFALKQILVLVHGFAYLGYWRLILSDWVAPALLNVVFNVIVYTITLAVIWFFYLFMREYRPSKVLLSVVRLTLFTYPLMLVAQLLGHGQLALQWVAVLALIVPLLVFIMVFTAKVWREADAHKANRPFLSQWQLGSLLFLMLLMLWIYVLPVMGLITLPMIALFGILLYNLFTSAIMLLVLQARMRHRLQQQIVQTERLKVVEKQIEFERACRQEQENLMAMLTHELKTPLAVIQMRADPNSLDGSMIRTSVREMNDVIDRCIQSTMLMERAFQVKLEDCDIQDIITAAASSLGMKHDLKIHHQDATKVIADEMMLFTIIKNLLDNANKYAIGNSPIIIDTEVDRLNGQANLILVIENMPGKAGKPDPQQVFNKYYRGPHAKQITGSGLGLYLVSELAKMMHAHIFYLPTDTHVRFILSVPIKE